MLIPHDQEWGVLGGVSERVNTETSNALAGQFTVLDQSCLNWII
jgi:hypothetical protein